MKHLIKSMRGAIQRQRGYGQDGFELVVMIQFDAAQFNTIKKQGCPLSAAMPQIKNVVLDACGVRGVPSYARPSMRQAYPRAKGGLVTLSVTFDVSTYTATQLGVNVKDWTAYKAIDLNTTLEATRNDGHMFAKSVLASHIGN